MNAAREGGNVPIVFSSTCAVYGKVWTIPITEDAPLLPISPYGRHEADHRTCSVGLRRGIWLALRPLEILQCKWMRPGRRKSARVTTPRPHLVPRAILAAMNRLVELTIFGDDYPTPDGTAIRDYVHVCDLADAHVAAVHFLLAGGESTSLNLGAGSGLSVRDIVKAIERVTGLDVPCRVDSRRLGDPAVLVADSSRARRLLDFSTDRSDVETIVRTAHSWLAHPDSGPATEP